jgi:sortase A
VRTLASNMLPLLRMSYGPGPGARCSLSLQEPQMSSSAFEVFAWSTGIALLAVYGTARLTASRDSELALDSFEQAQAVHAAVKPSPQPDRQGAPADVDTSLWSDARVAAYRKANAVGHAAPLAVLRIPALNLRVPVFPGTDSRTLDRGAGHIDGTHPPGSPGNVGLAAHRDGFFRALKDAQVGQRIYLDLLEGTVEYEVYALDIVEPTDVDVLADAGTPRLTLVTCYPFYFVGTAPKRFIVQARRKAPPHEDAQSALAQAPQRRDTTQP